MEKLLTITVPTYNVEKYLRQCLDSFCIEGISDLLEVLIIDDGSTDSSSEIAEEYGKKYPEQFRHIRKKNGGHGSTINCGIAEAAGKYFKVVDSDDWVDKEAMKELLECLQSSDSDVVYTNFYQVDDRTGKRKVEFEKPFPDVEYKKEYRFNEIKSNFFLKMHGYNIKTEILRTLPAIDEHCFYVDMEYVLFPVPWIDTVTFLDLFVYQYRVGLPNQSMNIQRMKRNSENYDRVLNRLLQYYEQCRGQISIEKKTYMEHVLGRMVASRMKIYLSQPYGKDSRNAMRAFDRRVAESYPAVYRAVENKAVLWLRRSGYRLYGLARLAYFWKERLS